MAPGAEAFQPKTTRCLKILWRRAVLDKATRCRIGKVLERANRVAHGGEIAAEKAADTLAAASEFLAAAAGPAAGIGESGGSRSTERETIGAASPIGDTPAVLRAAVTVESGGTGLCRPKPR